MKTTVYFENKFHYTDAKAIIDSEAELLSLGQTKRILKELCGISECRCCFSKQVGGSTDRDILRESACHYAFLGEL